MTPSTNQHSAPRGLGPGTWAMKGLSQTSTAGQGLPAPLTLPNPKGSPPSPGSPGGPCHSSAHAPAGAPGAVGVSPGTPGAEGRRTQPSQHHPRPEIWHPGHLPAGPHTPARPAPQDFCSSCSHCPDTLLLDGQGLPTAGLCSIPPCHRGPWGGFSRAFHKTAGLPPPALSALSPSLETVTRSQVCPVISSTSTSASPSPGGSQHETEWAWEGAATSAWEGPPPPRNSSPEPSVNTGPIAPDSPTVACTDARAYTQNVKRRGGCT